jgi:hypothetical protein
MLKKATVSAILILCASAAHVQSASADGLAQHSSAASVKVFVQSFYNWYVIKKDKEPDVRGTEEALKQKKQVFDIPLYKELMEDQEAAAKSPGELVGLDFDPFIASNGLIYDKYQAGKAVSKGTIYRVPVYGIGAGRKKPQFVVDAEVDTKNGRCVFTNFHYGKTKFPVNENLLSVLGALKKERQESGK